MNVCFLAPHVTDGFIDSGQDLPHVPCVSNGCQCLRLRGAPSSLQTRPARRSWGRQWALLASALEPPMQAPYSPGCKEEAGKGRGMLGRGQRPHLAFFSEDRICFPRVKVLDQQTLEVVFHSLLYLHWLNTWEKTRLCLKLHPLPAPKTAWPVYQCHRALPPQQWWRRFWTL